MTVPYRNVTLGYFRMDPDGLLIQPKMARRAVLFFYYYYHCRIFVGEEMIINESLDYRRTSKVSSPSAVSIPVFSSFVTWA